MVMNLEQLISDRLIKSCGSEAKAGLLKLCRIQIVVIQDRSALLIHSPNAWTEKQLAGFLLVGNLGQLIKDFGIKQLVLNNGEGSATYHQWNEIYFDFNGYFIDGDLTKLKIVNIPTIEELENMAGR